MSVCADCIDSFWVLARIASTSIAVPPWFAAPVSAEEDHDSVTITFHVPGKSPSQVQVQVSDQSVTVWGSLGPDKRRPMRLCALPCPVVADQIETTEVSDLLRVRMPKKRPAVDSRDTSPTT
jgi:HSP20 family molecular chaperone IbpA